MTFARFRRGSDTLSREDNCRNSRNPSIRRKIARSSDNSSLLTDVAMPRKFARQAKVSRRARLHNGADRPFDATFGYRAMKKLKGNAGRLASVFVLAALFLSGAAIAQNRPVTLADLGSRVGLSSATISPDGKQVAVVSSRANYSDNRFESSLVIVDSTTGTQRVLASKQGVGVSSPQWSPEGSQLAWLATEPGKEPQILVMSTRDANAKSVQITNAPKGVNTRTRGSQSFAWSPDSQTIAYITADPRPVLDGDERHNLSFEVVDNDYLATEPPPTFQVWLVSAAGGEPKRLTSGVESMTTVGWIQNSRSLVVASQPHPHNSPSDYAEFLHNSSMTTLLKTIDASSGEQRVMVPPPVRIASSTPVSSPDGTKLAFVRFRGREPWNQPHEVAIVPASGGEARAVTTNLDKDINDFAWLPGGNALLVSAPEGTRFGLWLQSLDGAAAKRLELGTVIDPRDVTVSEKGSVAFIGSESHQPHELYVMTSFDAKPRRLTNFNGQIAALALGRTETVRWRLDGYDQTGVLIYPPQFRKGSKYPLVLDIHGGPEGTSTEAFDLFDQMLAGQGWLVFKPNYRGSSSQGAAFQTAIVKDLGEGPGRDVMAGISAVKALGVVDEGRIAVSGWSYGGFMTAWLIGNFQGWSSAVAGAPLTNNLDWYNLSCCNAWADPVLGGSPWLNDNFENYWRWSPVTYARNVRTPTLILQNMGDPEVPYTGSYHFYHALRDNGAPVKFVIYPISGHGYNGDPVHQRDTLRRWIGWIEEHFRAPAQVSN
jgi:dipeptidyl aminopeptidase/acylaminoacyl peptidase